MRSLQVVLWVAGFLQILIALANLIIPKKLDYHSNLVRVTPVIRQIFIVHSAYIVGVLLLFAAISIGFTSDLAGGKGLGRFLSIAMSLFWLCRAPLQVFYYDEALRRVSPFGNAAFVAVTLYLAASYAVAAFFGGV